MCEKSRVPHRSLCIWHPAPKMMIFWNQIPFSVRMGEAFIKMVHACKSFPQRDRYFALFFCQHLCENPEKIHQILWKSNNICIELKTCKVTEYELNQKPPTYALKWSAQLLQVNPNCGLWLNIACWMDKNWSNAHASHFIHCHFYNGRGCLLCTERGVRCWKQRRLRM